MPACLSLPALVLSAGLGTRLDPLTRLVAKPAVPLGGRTLIERVLAWLGAQGVARRRAESAPPARNHCGRRRRRRASRPARALFLGTAACSDRPAVRGTRCRCSTTDTFLIVNGDTLCDIALAPMLAAHRATGADVTMAVVPNPAPDHYNGIVLDDDDRVTGSFRRGAQTAAGTSSASRSPRRGVRAAPDGVAGGDRRRHLPRAAWRTARRVFARSGSTTPFLDVGTPRDY